LATALIVDDVEVTRFALSHCLKDLGHDQAEAHDPESARHALSRRRYDVVFLDWHLKKQSGLDLIAAIHQHAPGTPVIVISGVEGEDKAEEARRAGADAFLTKPLDSERVAAAMRRAGAA